MTSLHPHVITIRNLNNIIKEKDELIQKLNNKIEQKNEEITDLIGRLNIADPAWREYQHIDPNFPRNIDISHSDTIGSEAADAIVISDINQLGLAEGKSRAKKKSTKKKHSKLQKSKRRRKNKKN